MLVKLVDSNESVIFSKVCNWNDHPGLHLGSIFSNNSVENIYLIHMNLNLFLFADLSEESIERERQDILMKRFFSAAKVQFVETISHGNINTEVCGEAPWERIVCVGWAVDGVWISDIDPGKLLLPFVPSLVKTLGISNCNQKYPVDTRLLPREVRYVEMRNNKIYGSLNLATLPQNLEWFSAPHNRISGMIALTMLPPKFERLDLSYNQITQDTVYYGSLPETVSYITLVKNKILHIDTTDERVTLQAKMVFRNMIDKIVRSEGASNSICFV